VVFLAKINPKVQCPALSAALAIASDGRKLLAGPNFKNGVIVTDLHFLASPPIPEGINTGTN
jgi:hypothetical protein